MNRGEEESKDTFVKPSQQPGLLQPYQTPREPIVGEPIISEPINEFITAQGTPLCDWGELPN